MTGGSIGTGKQAFDLGFAPLESLHPLLQGRGVHAVLDGRHDAGDLAMDEIEVVARKVNCRWFPFGDLMMFALSAESLPRGPRQ